MAYTKATTTRKASLQYFDSSTWVLTFYTRSIEPECEDNPIQAKIRKERSQSAAVDAQWVFDQSSIEPCVGLA